MTERIRAKLNIDDKQLEAWSRGNPSVMLLAHLYEILVDIRDELARQRTDKEVADRAKAQNR